MCTVVNVVSLADKVEILTDAVSRSRCVLAVVSPGFIADELCRFCFENTVRDGVVNVIYVMYGGITSLDDTALTEEVRVAFHSSRRRFVSPLTEADLEIDDALIHRCKTVDHFWVKVRLAIPNTASGSCCMQDKK